MRLLTFSFLLICAMAFGGCSLTRPSLRPIPKPVPQSSPTVIQKEHPASDTGKSEPAYEEHSRPRLPKADTSASEPAVPEPAEVVRPEMSFSGLDCDHVRHQNMGKLPDGTITLDLDRLKNEFCYPFKGKLTSDYGVRGRSFHTGIDIDANARDTIRAAFPGVVRMSKYYSSYGNIVVIRHYDGFETVYSHGSKNLVAVNDKVEAGTPIAIAGRTGRSSGIHLHFEFRAGGEHIDPKLLVDPYNHELRSGKLYLSSYNGLVAASYSEEGSMQLLVDATSVKSDSDAETARALAASTINGQPKGSSTPAPVYYVVQDGDILGRIAIKHNTTVRKLCQLNNIKETAIIRPKQRLRVK